MRCRGGNTTQDQKIRTSQWIGSIRKTGAKVSSPFVILRYQKGTGCAPQAAFVVSKKVGASVVRNKVKRRLREIFRTRIRPSAEPGYYVFIARAPIVNVKVIELERDIVDLMRRI